MLDRRISTTYEIADISKNCTPRVVVSKWLFAIEIIFLRDMITFLATVFAALLQIFAEFLSLKILY